MSRARGSRKPGFTTDEQKAELVKAMSIARDAANKVTDCYKANTIPYAAAITVRENCRYLAALISKDGSIFEPRWHSSPGHSSRKD